MAGTPNITTKATSSLKQKEQKTKSKIKVLKGKPSSNLPQVTTKSTNIEDRRFEKSWPKGGTARSSQRKLDLMQAENKKQPYVGETPNGSKVMKYGKKLYKYNIKGK